MGQPDARVAGQRIGDDGVLVDVFGAGQLVAVAHAHDERASGEGAEIDTHSVFLATHGVSSYGAVLSRMISSG